MKVMNVGNVNYANQRQQNFGMKLAAATPAIEAIGEKAFLNVSESVRRFRTKEGKELVVSILFRDNKLILDTEEVGMKVNRLIVSKNPGECTFVESGCCNLTGKLMTALDVIHKFFA